MGRSPRFLLLLVACVTGCNPCNQGEQASGPRGAPKEAKPAAKPAAPEPAKPAPEPPKPLAEESAVQGVLQSWLDAQNTGDFTSYGRLYASKFQGVKRVGNKVTRMDRKAWLADRERMFAKPMTVSAPEPEIDIRERAATISFTQTWESGSFKDTGPKRLLIVKDGQDLRIAHEELLSSTVLRSQKQLDALAGFAFVVDLGGLWAMLGSREGEVPEHGPLERIDAKDVYAVKAPFSGEPPAEIAAYDGKSVQITTTTGMQCGAKLSAPQYVVQVVPHFGEVEMWQEALAKSAPAVPAATPTPAPAAAPAPAAPAAPPAAPLIDIPAELWSMSWHKNLALRVTLDDLAHCSGAPLFMRDATAAMPLTAKKLDEVPREEDVKSAFRQLKSYAARQAAFDAERGDPPAPGLEQPSRWDERAVFKLDAFRLPDTSETIVALRINPEASCGDESPRAWAVFAVPDDAKKPARMVKDLDDDVPGEVVLVLDVERDGHLEYIVRDVLDTSWSLVTSTGEVLTSWSLDYQDCPC